MTKRRKTKKEKIIASLRRQIRFQRNQAVFSSQDRKEPITPLIEKESKISSSELEQKIEFNFWSNEQISQTKKDLLKSLFFSLIAIIFEFVLYWRLS